ncbi:MAG TPA: MFS transporter, partial [Chloroflexota bacterium]|nr:MFS transporter [Chloroflexota bacterium]
MKKASTTDAAERPGSSRLRSLLVLAALVLLAANLRPALTSVAPLIGEIRAGTGVSNGVAGLLTTLPLLAFALLSPVAPRLARAIGMRRVLLLSLLALAAGILARSSGTLAALFLGTALLGAAIAVGNVLLPSIVKREFPERVGLMTSVYSTALGISAALAAGVSAPVAQLVGWRAALALWAIPAFVAAVAWLPGPGSGRTGSAPDVSHRGVGGLWRSGLAWQVTLFMGLQSLAYYVALTWLPEILIDEGLSVARAGWMLGLSKAVA